jgi:hypothetical protein
MRHALICHPATPCRALTSIEVEASRPEAGTLLVRYFLTGDLKKVARPPVGGPTRADGLWRHTCFEAFVRPASGPGYFEFNSNWSLRWAAYRFSAYREGLQNAETARIGQTFGTWHEGHHMHEVPMILGDASAEAEGWQAGISMVIEEIGGRKSYWALAHPPGGKPDFHHPACFVLDLPPPSAP